MSKTAVDVRTFVPMEPGADHFVSFHEALKDCKLRKKAVLQMRAVVGDLENELKLNRDTLRLLEEAK